MMNNECKKLAEHCLDHLTEWAGFLNTGYDVRVPLYNVEKPDAVRIANYVRNEGYNVELVDWKILFSPNIFELRVTRKLNQL